MRSDTGELSATLSEERAETARHRQACETAGSISAVWDDLDRHVQAMDGMMLRMDSGMHEMSECSSGEASRISGGMIDVRAELSDHRARLEAIADLTEAHRECTRYAPMMEAALLSMSAGLDGMSCMMTGH